MNVYKEDILAGALIAIGSLTGEKKVSKEIVESYTKAVIENMKEQGIDAKYSNFDDNLFYEVFDKWYKLDNKGNTLLVDEKTERDLHKEFIIELPSPILNAFRNENVIEKGIIKHLDNHNLENKQETGRSR